MNSFSERLKMALKENNMKAIELSEKTGISKSSISDWINGKYEAKSDKIVLIAKALNVSESFLIGLDVPLNKTDNFTPTILTKITTKAEKLEPKQQELVLEFIEEQLKQKDSDVI
jgi:transcriptional regulator with XRE-family HTH domain